MEKLSKRETIAGSGASVGLQNLLIHFEAQSGRVRGLEDSVTRDDATSERVSFKITEPMLAENVFR